MICQVSFLVHNWRNRHRAGKTNSVIPNNQPSRIGRKVYMILKVNIIPRVYFDVSSL